MSSSVPNREPSPQSETESAAPDGAAGDQYKTGDLRYNMEITLEEAFSGKTTIIRVPNIDASGARIEKTLSVNLPAGLEDGTQIRLGGEGEYNFNGGPQGNLYIFISIAEHKLFKRDGADIRTRVAIPVLTAALGGSIEMPTIDGSRVVLTVPPGLQTGHQFRVQGRGMMVIRSAGRGDMYIEVIVQTPVNLTRRQQDLLRQALEEPAPESRGFFGRGRK